MQSPDFDYELSLLPPGTRFLLGIDEVGRGPWAGPVTIGAFLLDLDHFDPSAFASLPVRDSKKLPTQKRELAYAYFKDNGYKFETFSASSLLVDRLGIGNAIEKLIVDAMNYFSSQFDYCLVDGNLNLKTTLPYRSVVAADSHCFSVAAASICAKVDRDKQMDKFETLYPGYGFASHKGYGTAAHLKALQALGVTPIHRTSYKPIQKLFQFQSVK